MLDVNFWDFSAHCHFLGVHDTRMIPTSCPIGYIISMDVISYEFYLVIMNPIHEL